MVTFEALDRPVRPRREDRDSSVVCDQAIFTSVRTPMGEGYRIIAASKGLRPEEKQSITQHSPSHDALTGRSPDATAIAFYRLPSGRLCAAFSRNAGTEHTGRGGQRVYTHIAAFAAEDFRKFGYNAFDALSALREVNRAAPRLSGPDVLEELTLPTEKNDAANPAVVGQDESSLSWRCHILDQVLSGARQIVLLEDEQRHLTESILLAVPGSMRIDVSFAVGLRFSPGRGFALSILGEEEATLRSRCAGQNIRLVDVRTGQPPSPPDSDWIAFVRRHWQGGDTSTLYSRTSREYGDASRDRLDRIGRLYNKLDDTASLNIAETVEQASLFVSAVADDLEGAIVQELLTATQQRLRKLLSEGRSILVENQWPAVLGIWRESGKGTSFMQPVIEHCLQAQSAADPHAAARLALAACADVPPSCPLESFDQTIEQTLTRLAAWCEQASDAQVAKLAPLLDEWKAIKPNSPVISYLQERCTRVSMTSPDPHPSACADTPSRIL